MKRDYRLNTRLNGSEYDAVYKFMQDHKLESLADGIRLMIHFCTSYPRKEKLVPQRNIPERIM